jgi:CHAP domain
VNCKKDPAITVVMSYLDVVSRVADLQSMLQQIPTLADPQATQSPAATGATATQPAASDPTSFSSVLASYTSPASSAAPTDPASAGDSAGQRALAAAETQIGQTEQPPGSNDGPAIAMYRSAVQGAYPGAPWCAYFASWAAAQAGAPMGDQGQGFGSVAEITSWAQATGRLTNTPAPGELILFGTEHVGIVKSVNADGTLTTVEGNASNAVSVETRSPSEATGYVRL